MQSLALVCRLCWAELLLSENPDVRQEQIRVFGMDHGHAVDEVGAKGHITAEIRPTVAD